MATYDPAYLTFNDDSTINLCGFLQLHVTAIAFNQFAILSILLYVQECLIDKDKLGSRPKKPTIYSLIYSTIILFTLC